MTYFTLVSLLLAWEICVQTCPKNVLKFLASEVLAGKGACQLFSWTDIRSEKILILKLLPPVF